MATVRHLGLFPEPFSEKCPTLVNTQDIIIGNLEFSGDLISQAAQLNAWMTLDQVMAFIWRVKTWRITHSSSYTLSYAGPFPLDFDELKDNYKVDESFPPNFVTDEKQLSCGLYFEWSESDNVFGNRNDISQSHGYRPAQINYHAPTNMFRPYIGVFRFGQARFYPNIFEPSEVGFDDHPPFYGEVGSVTLQMSAVGYLQSFPIYAYIDPNDEIEASFSHTIAAEEYWPYDPNDGLGPIYDSATGEQLREFPA
jgi:hypothetical protein